MTSAAPFVVLIPARLASTRLPDKPLADIEGLPMVVRVARRAQRSRAQRVVVAADDRRILEACQAHGIEAIATRADHPSGSDRLAEACHQLAFPDDRIVVNVQGDEPLIDPALVDAVAGLLDIDPDSDMSTAAHAIEDPADFASPNVVKVVLDARGRAMYFSRSPIPFDRDAAKTHAVSPLLPRRMQALRHVGLYAYRAGFLRRFPLLPPAPVESTELLEQLRVLWHGHRIAVHQADRAPAPGVDTPEDLERVRTLFRGGDGGL